MTKAFVRGQKEIFNMFFQRIVYEWRNGSEQGNIAVQRLWSLIGLLLIFPWGKLLTAVGLIDVPGQVRQWAALVSVITSPDINIGAALIGFSIIVGANLDWLRSRFRLSLLTASTEARSEPAGGLTGDQLIPDIWLQDAVSYAVHGRWLSDDDQTISNETEMKKASEIAHKMRELAGLGKYLIWGKNRPARLHQPIPNEFWIDNQIDLLRLVGDTAENVRTERATSGYSKYYFSLKIHKSQTEQMWHALSLTRTPQGR
jgi:hypothetical protein